jgi:hypothetical protein
MIMKPFKPADRTDDIVVSADLWGSNDDIQQTEGWRQ